MQTDTRLPKAKINAKLAILELDGKALLRSLLADMGHDPDLIPLRLLGQIAARLTLIGHPARPWSAKYIRNVCRGTQKASKKLIDAVMRCGMIEDGAPDILALGHNITVLALGKVDPGAVLQIDSRVCPECGIAFIPRSWNQRFYPKECSIKRKRK